MSQYILRVAVMPPRFDYQYSLSVSPATLDAPVPARRIVNSIVLAYNLQQLGLDEEETIEIFNDLRLSQTSLRQIHIAKSKATKLELRGAIATRPLASRSTNPVAARSR
jgi:hypothetical protein